MQDTEENTAAIKTLQQQNEQVTATLQRHAMELERLREKEELERRNLMLSLENAMLRFERRLPPGDPADADEVKTLRRRVETLEQEVANLRRWQEQQQDRP